MLLFQPLPFQSGQTAKLHVQDGLGLDLAKVQSRHQVRPRRLHIGRIPNNLDDFVHAVQGQQKPLHQVVAVPCLLQLEFGPAPNNCLTVFDEQDQTTLQRQDLGLPVHQGQHDCVERRPERRMAEQVVQHHVGLGVPAQFDDDPHAMPVGLVPDVGDSLQLLFPGEIGDLLDQMGFVDLIGNLRDDYLFPVSPHLLDRGGGLHDDAAAPGGVGVEDTLVTEDIGACWEIWALDHPHQLLGGGVRVVYQQDNGVANLAQVMGRDVRGHAHGDARRAVDQHVWHARRQYRWFAQ